MKMRMKMKMAARPTKNRKTTKAGRRSLLPGGTDRIGPELLFET
jgi:hypothetical protein